MRCSLVLFLVSFVMVSCHRHGDNKEKKLFSLVSSDSSGITFQNTITTNDTVNILSYEYLYNGGGVAVGDFNNDSLPDLFFSANQVQSKLYVNEGDFRFRDVTTTCGIDTRGVWAYGVSVVDINGDSYQDIYLCAGGMGNKDAFPNKLYINNGDLTFTERADEYGLNDKGESVHAAFFDYDRDGDLDVYIVTGGGFERSAVIPFPLTKDGSARNRDRLYRNDFDTKRGHPFFTEVSLDAGIVHGGFGLGISVVDINDDQWPDVYVTNDYLSSDHLYINNHDGTFSEESQKYFQHTSHFAMGNDAGDINNDGLIDILAVDMLPEDHYRRMLMFGPNQFERFYYSIRQGYSFQYMRNTLQLNRGGGLFSEIGQLSGISKTDWSWAPLIADLDNDSFQDIFITNGFGKDVTDLDFVKFRQEAEMIVDPAHRRKAFLDSLANRRTIETPNYVYRNRGDLTFTRMSSQWGLDIPSLSNGAAYADLDRDGDLDIVANNINAEAFLFRNNAREIRGDSSNYLAVKLIGSNGNPAGIGSVVKMFSGTFSQIRYQYVYRGFESTVTEIIHFGLGTYTSVDSIEVRWPDGKKSIVRRLPANRQISINYNSSHNDGVDTPPTALTTMIRSEIITHRHQENEFNDFNQQPLLQRKLSHSGPGVAVGDVNGDSLEDVYVAGAYGQSGTLYLQFRDGSYRGRSLAGTSSEELGCLFVDIDNDGDLDLYVVSGGNEFYKKHERYQDKVYVNNGKGEFTSDPVRIPDTRSAGSCVVAADIDGDDDLDLFVGGRNVPLRYPETPESYLLINDGGKYTDKTDLLAPGLRLVGMVTSAVLSDYDNDNDHDLLVVGDGMPVTVFTNNAGRFTNDTERLGLLRTSGMWNSISAADLDNDGDPDYVLGNLGRNTNLFASASEPMEIHYADFDGNGSVDPVLCYYEGGKSYPQVPLDILVQQVPRLKKRILFYRQYAGTSTDELLAMTGVKDFRTLRYDVLESSLLRNDGTNMSLVPLPVEAQFSPIFGTITDDVNDDGFLDILAVGNFHHTEVVYGRYDAGKGVMLMGKGNLSFQFVPPMKSGFVVPGDARALATIRSQGKVFVIASQNDNDVVVHSFVDKKRKYVNFNAGESHAITHLSNGTQRRTERYHGSGYLSQSSPSLPVGSSVRKVSFYNSRGELTRELE
jgi:enediyne biosynthesis protein E4